MNRTALFLDNIPATLRDSFKGACYRKGKTMKAVLIKFMEDYSRQIPPPGPNPMHRFTPRSDRKDLCGVCGQNRQVHAQ